MLPTATLLRRCVVPLRFSVVVLVSLLAFFMASLPMAHAQTPDRSEPANDDDILFLLKQDDQWSAYIMNADGSNQRPVTNHLNFPRSYINVYSAVFSPDRTQIILALIKTNRSTYENEHRLYRVNANGEGLKLLWNGNADYLDPVWTPSGDQIGFTAFSDAAGSHIYVINSDGSGLEELVSEEGQYNYDPVWSPNGEQILFSSNINGSRVVSVINADGTDSHKVMSDYNNAAWSPDGRKIAVTWREPGLYLVNPDGSGLEQVIQMDQVSNPTWSPDGESIAFVSTQDGQNNLYRINTDGDELIQLTYTIGVDFACLRWLPDGEQLKVMILKEGVSINSPQANIFTISADGEGVMTALTDDSTTEILSDCYIGLFG